MGELQFFFVLADLGMLQLIGPLGAMMVLISLLLMRLKKRRGPQRNITPREQLEHMKQEKGMRRDLEGVMVEIEQLAKRFGHQLDAKTIELEQLMREADEKIAKMEALKTELGLAESGQVSTRGDGFAGAIKMPDETYASSVEVLESPEMPRTSLPVDDIPVNDLTARVYRLADQGCSVDEIARQLDEHHGKVELILSLRSA